MKTKIVGILLLIDGLIHFGSGLSFDNPNTQGMLIAGSVYLILGILVWRGAKIWNYVSITVLGLGSFIPILTWETSGYPSWIMISLLIIDIAAFIGVMVLILQQRQTY